MPWELIMRRVLRWFRHIRWRKPRTTFSYSYESNCQVRPTWTGSENDVPTHWKPMRAKTRFYFCIILDTLVFITLGSSSGTWNTKWILCMFSSCNGVNGCWWMFYLHIIHTGSTSSPKKNHRQENKMKVPSRILASSEYIPSACLQISSAGECTPF